MPAHPLSPAALRVSAVVLGGGQHDALARSAGVASKALVPYAGRPLVSYVLDALRGCPEVGSIIYVGELGTLGTQVAQTVPAGETFIGSLKDADRFGGGEPDLFVMVKEPDVTQEQAREALVQAFPNLYLDVTLNQTYRDRISDLSQQTFTTTNGLLLLAIFIASLGVANTLGMNLSSRQHEVAVLRTLGLTRRGVQRLVTAEGIVVVTLGTILGIVTGLLLSNVITAGASALTGYRITPVFPWRLIVTALIASPVVGLVASLFPARRAARLSPKRALGGA